MDNLETKLKNLPDIELPEGLHGRIVRAAAVRRFRFPFLVLTSGVVANLVLLAWRIGTKVVETDALHAFQLLFSGFTASSDFAADFLEMARSYLPLTTMLVFAINLLLVIYLFRLYSAFNGLQGYRLEKVE